MGKQGRQTTMFAKLCRAMACAVLGWMIGVPAGAEEAKTAAKEQARGIEEITVTSRRVEESQQDIPVAVTAFTEANIAEIAPRTLRDFDGLSPNVRIGMNTAGPSAGAIYIRGIGYADIEKTQAPAVGIVVDGVYQGSSTGQLIDTFDVRQMEINRGPQGVLQGKNTTGGSIVVTRYRPEFNGFGGTVGVQYGDYDEQQFKGRINIPLIDDQLALKIAGITKTQNGYYDNITKLCDECAGDIDYSSATAALRWRPVEAFDATFTYDYIKDDGDIPPQDPTWNGDNPYQNAANFNEYQQYDVNAYALNMAYTFDFGTLSSVSSYNDAEDSVGQDFDGDDRTAGAVPLGTLHTLREQTFEVWTQELKLDGDLGFVDGLRYTVGGYYYKSELDFAQGTNLIVQLPANLPPAQGGLGLPPGTPCSVIPGFKNNPGPIGSAMCQLPNSYANQQSGEEVKSYAAFGALTWDVTDQIELHAGLRYISEEKDFTTRFGTRAAPVGGPVDRFYGDPINPPTLPAITTFAGFPVNANDDWDKTVGEASATWKYTDVNMVYASYSQGFRSGGFSIRGTDPARLSFLPETIDAYEIGSKNEFLEHRLQVNVTAFYMDLSDQQFSSILNQAAPPGTNTLILNSQGTESQGAELEVVASVGENWTLMAVGGWQDVQSKDNSFSCLDLPVPPLGQACNPVTNPNLFVNGVAQNINFQGGDTGFTSKWNYALTGMYDREIGPGHLYASTSWRETDDVIIAVQQGGIPFEEPGYGLWDARLAYEWALNERDKVMFEVIGKNLADEEYRQQRLFLGNGLFQGWGPPRTWSVSVSYLH